QARPVGVVGGPSADFLQVQRAVGQLVGPPGQKIDVLGGAQLEDALVDFGQAKGDDAGAGALDVAAELVFDLSGGDGFETGDHHGVAGGQLGWRTVLGHG